MINQIKAIGLFFIFSIFLFSKPTFAQEETQAPADSVSVEAPEAFPVLIGTDTLFLILAPYGPVTTQERAEAVTNRLERLIDTEEELDSMAFSLTEDGEDLLFMYKEDILMALTPEDVELSGKSKEELSAEYLEIFRLEVAELADEQSLIKQLTRGGIFVGILVFLLIIVRILNTQINRIIDKAKIRFEKYVPTIQIRNYKLLTQENSLKAAEIILKILKIGFLLIFINIALPLSLRVFPTTQGLGQTLLGYIIDPLVYMGEGFIGYIPELFTIAVIIVVTRFIVRGLEFFAEEIQHSRLKLAGFYPEWAIPTFNLVKLVLYVFSFIVIFPYLPGSDSPAFQGVSVFLGILISLGSTSAISNIIAGLVIIYMRAFKKGDRVKIGETVGDVIEKTMLVTRVKTIKNEEVTIPNATILAGNTINYSVENNGPGLILNSSVTIGYDVPWRKVHEMLIEAASKAKMAELEPKPFVLQTSLDDFYVSYQINVYTKTPKKSAVIYSSLHANIQDVFAREGVEIMSPHYRENRDGAPTIPPVHVENPADDKPKKPNLPG